MWYVYVIESQKRLGYLYIGSTNSITRRLSEHNEGLSESTRNLKPWKLLCYVAVLSEKQARSLEQYFKSASGKSVLKRRILETQLDGLPSEV